MKIAIESLLDTIERQVVGLSFSRKLLDDLVEVERRFGAQSKEARALRAAIEQYAVSQKDQDLEV